jgi:predicted metal-binding membrane protein
MSEGVDADAGIGKPRLGLLTTLVGAGYYFIWAVLGLVAYPLGVALAAIEMRQPALARSEPFEVGLVVLAAGLLQFTDWKARQLACCRAAPRRCRPSNVWHRGVSVSLEPSGPSSSERVWC